jgi:hypothetical protein
MWPRKLFGLSTIVLGAATLALARRGAMHWGATADEVARVLPGDGLVVRADLQSTRALTIHAGTAAVWPWVAQLGQGRGGFYSYDRVENLLGCDIHSSDVVLPGHQDVRVGDQIRLAPEMPLTVAVADPGAALVLTGGILMGAVASPWTFSWAFVLADAGNGSTRLLVRERYGYTARWAALVVEPTSLVSLVMTRKMLRGVRERAERVQPVAQDPAPSAVTVG